MLRSIKASQPIFQWQRDFLNYISSQLSDKLYMERFIENSKKRGVEIPQIQLNTVINYENDCNHSISEALSYSWKLPNWTDERVPIGDASSFKILKNVGEKFTGTVEPAEQWMTKRNLFSMPELGLKFGPKSYTFYGPLANLENALIDYAIDKLLAKSFQLIHVPELVDSSVIQSCGFPTDSYRSQVYKIYDGNGNYSCLTGTAEMAIAGMFSGRCFEHHELPQKVCAVSRCFRAEASDNRVDKGLFRVHQFYKVEMFIVSHNSIEKSNKFLEELANIEEEILQDLGLTYRALEIPSEDLGLPAYRKIDLEAWLPGHDRFGELTSTSNCIDWQASRLGIQYKDEDGTIHYAHTLNGTALAVPRVIMALIETHQNGDVIKLPSVLHNYFGNSVLSGLARCWRYSPSQKIPGIFDF